ncbi:MAG: TRAP transporter small permease subunit [Hyphomicrobium sp.]|jgi:TRAP-type C4-dicarboxylate transport system permease small subunit
MRRLLDNLYLASGGLAAAFLAASCLIVLLQVSANLLSDLSEWMWNTPITLGIPNYAELAGYAFAAASFLGLGYTFRTDGHIRVSVLMRSLSVRSRLWLEAWCLCVASLISLFLSWSAVIYVADSLYFGDVSSGSLAVPLWIPQSAMAFGLIVLTVAILDRAVEFAVTARSTTAAPRTSARMTALAPGMTYSKPGQI